MNKTPVWYADNYMMHMPGLYLNRGEAMDINDSFEIQSTLVHECPIENIIANAPLTVYSVKYTPFYETGVSTSWHTSEDAAKKEAIEMGLDLNDIDCRIKIAELQKPYLKPVEMPVNTYLRNGQKGLYTYINTNPEIHGMFDHGHKRRGKIFFPDRSCAAELCEGPVVITEIKDKGNYGFFIGHMQKFNTPSDNALDDYIRDVENYYGGFRFVSGTFGNYIIVTGPVEEYGPKKGTRPATDTILVASPDGKAQNENAMIIANDNTAKIIREISIADFLCEGYHGCKFDELVAKFTPFKFDSYDAVYSDKYISDLFDDAVDAHIIEPKTIHGTFYAKISTHHLLRHLTDFSEEEIKTLIDEVNKINQTANETIMGKVKRGKLRLT